MSGRSGAVYGLSAAGTHRSRKRRHVVWGEMQGKCGRALVELTDDLGLPLCGLCRTAMTRLAREQPYSVPTWS